MSVSVFDDFGGLALGAVHLSIKTVYNSHDTRIRLLFPNPYLLSVNQPCTTGVELNFHPIPYSLFPIPYSLLYPSKLA
jgi:hypothetical protein